MDENEVMMEEDIMDIPDDPDYDPDEWERKRKEEEEKRLKPYKEAAAQRKESTAIIAEHDELIADMLYEIIINELGE